MFENLDRRSFLKKSAAASAGAALALSFEEKALLAEAAKQPTAKIPEEGIKGLPMGKIGKVQISRLICGGNLISGYAHSRDLIYVSELLKKYFTEEKIMETWRLCEENGINTMISYCNDRHALDIYKKYRKEHGGKIQLLAQLSPKENDLAASVKQAVDNGAVGAFLLGNIGDLWTKENKVDLIGKLVSLIKENGLIAGVAGHSLEMLVAVETAGIEPDFYMKTLHSNNYWSCRQPNQNKDVIDNYAVDNYWDMTPEQTAEFMKDVKRPWIAYKVLAAGAIHPKVGFKHAFENGADFACVGMFDFQVKEDVAVAINVLSGTLDRKRPWNA